MFPPSFTLYALHTYKHEQFQMNNSKATIWRPDLVYDNIETKEDIEETLKNDLVKIDYAKDSHFRDDDKERNHFMTPPPRK